jgi:hypothetical protein
VEAEAKQSASSLVALIGGPAGGASELCHLLLIPVVGHFIQQHLIKVDLIVASSHIN